MPLTTKWATRWARVLVLPDPAPAITSRGPASARCGRIPRCSATAAPCELFRQPDFPQSTRPRDRRQRSNRYRLRPAPGELGSRPRRFEPAAGPPAMLGWYKARRHGLASSVGMRAQAQSTLPHWRLPPRSPPAVNVVPGPRAVACEDARKRKASKGPSNRRGPRDGCCCRKKHRKKVRLIRPRQSEAEQGDQRNYGELPYLEVQSLPSPLS